MPCSTTALEPDEIAVEPQTVFEMGLQQNLFDPVMTSWADKPLQHRARPLLIKFGFRPKSLQPCHVPAKRHEWALLTRFLAPSWRLFESPIADGRRRQPGLISKIAPHVEERQVDLAPVSMTEMRQKWHTCVERKCCIQVSHVGAGMGGLQVSCECIKRRCRCRRDVVAVEQAGQWRQGCQASIRGIEAGQCNAPRNACQLWCDNYARDEIEENEETYSGCLAAPDPPGPYAHQQYTRKQDDPTYLREDRECGDGKKKQDPS